MVLVPGFIDPHQHPLIGGLALAQHHCIAYYDTANPYGPAQPGLQTLEAVAARMREVVAQEPGDDMVLFWGFDSIALGGHLTAAWIDEHVPSERPVSVWDCSMHFIYANSVWLRKLGKLPHNPGVGFDENGEPNGQFLGTRATGVLMKHLAPKLGDSMSALRAMKHTTDLSHQGGITTVAEMLLGNYSLTLEYPLFKEFYHEPGCPIRCVAVCDGKKLKEAYFGLAGQAASYIQGLQSESTDRLIFNNGVKFFSDDAFVGLTMQVNKPGYIDGHEGIWINDPGPAFADLMRPFWEAGMRLHVHSNGDMGNDSTLAALADLQMRKPRFDHRFTFEHFGMSTQAISRRVAALGACCSVNIHYPHLRGEINEKHLGVDRAHLASRLRSLVDLGVPTAVHTDAPVAPPVPLAEMWIATERLGQSGKVLGPAERVTRHQALKMVTVDAAYVLSMDHLIGSIETGKLADFTVLDADPLDPEIKDIREIGVWGTVVGGVKYPRDRQWELTANLPSGFFPGLAVLNMRHARSALKRGLWRLASRAGGLTDPGRLDASTPVPRSRL